MRPNRIALVTLCSVVAGCHERVPLTALPPTVPVAARNIPAAEPTPPAPAAPPPAAAPPSPAPLDHADRAFAAGTYDDAARGYETYLRTNPTGKLRDQALFFLGLSYVLRPAPASDWQRASMYLKELVDNYPNSPLRPPASLVLSLHSDLDQMTADSKQRDLRIKQLSTELDRLKKIDADRRKRP
jgi:hypothetical protein